MRCLLTVLVVAVVVATETEDSVTVPEEEEAAEFSKFDKMAFCKKHVECAAHEYCSTSGCRACAHDHCPRDATAEKCPCGVHQIGAKREGSWATNVDGNIDEE